MERTSKIRINGDLRGTRYVRVLAANGEDLGVLTLAEALRAALQAGLDLVEVSPSSRPPVCKILDFAALSKPPSTHDARRLTEPDDE